MMKYALMLFSTYVQYYYLHPFILVRNDTVCIFEYNGALEDKSQLRRTFINFKTKTNMSDNVSHPEGVPATKTKNLKFAGWKPCRF